MKIKVFWNVTPRGLVRKHRPTQPQIQQYCNRHRHGGGNLEVPEISIFCISFELHNLEFTSGGLHKKEAVATW
jgi:hypothetical protein